MTMGIGALGDLLPKQSRGGRIYGIVIGVVTSIQDQKSLNRVQVQFPWLPDSAEGAQAASPWARVVAPMAGGERGLYLPLLVGDEVAVMFEHGDPNHPIVVGALWNGSDAAPGPAPAMQEDGTPSTLQYVLKSQSGHTITLDDAKNKGQITIADNTGKNKIVFDTTNNAVTIDSGGDMTLTAQGKITLSAQKDVEVDCANFTLSTQQGYTLSAKTTGALKATSELDITCMQGVNINNNGLLVK